MKYPEYIFTPTEKILLEVMNEPRFKAWKKYQILLSYKPKISRTAFKYIEDRIILIERLKYMLNKN